MYGESPVSGEVQYSATTKQSGTPVKWVPILEESLEALQTKSSACQAWLRPTSGRWCTVLIEDRPIINDALGANRSQTVPERNVIADTSGLLIYLLKGGILPSHRDLV